MVGSGPVVVRSFLPLALVSMESNAAEQASLYPCPWPIGKGSSLPSWRGGFKSHPSLLSSEHGNGTDRSSVLRSQLTLSIDRGSVNGRPPGFEPGNGGSIPPPRAYPHAVCPQGTNFADGIQRMPANHIRHVLSLPVWINQSGTRRPAHTRRL